MKLELMVPIHARKVYVDKRIPTVYDRTVLTREHVTLVVAISNHGSTVPPIAIFKGKNLISNLVDEGPPGIKACVTSNGWMDKKTCLI